MPFGIPIDIRHIFATKIFAYLLIGIIIISLLKYTIVVLEQYMPNNTVSVLGILYT